MANTMFADDIGLQNTTHGSYLRVKKVEVSCKSSMYFNTLTAAAIFRALAKNENFFTLDYQKFYF